MSGLAVEQGSAIRNEFGCDPGFYNVGFLRSTTQILTVSLILITSRMFFVNHTKQDGQWFLRCSFRFQENKIEVFEIADEAAFSSKVYSG
jgi:hypothetical protein